MHCTNVTIYFRRMKNNKEWKRKEKGNEKVDVKGTEWK